MAVLKSVIHTIFDILLPQSCPGCRKSNIEVCDECLEAPSAQQEVCFFCHEGADTSGICGSCKTQTPIGAITWSWHYHHPIAQAIISAFKYRNKKTLAKYLSKRIQTSLKNWDLPKDTLVIPVPLHHSKEKKRGFNQSYLLAMHLGFPVHADLVMRVKATKPQAKTHSRKERFEEIKDSFKITSAELVVGKTILIIDDVATTGATVSELAKTLHKAGAKDIFAATLAHG